mmetsp:Transcript_79534/g.257596  ORF Transcript_79534/g.257596 Transcript_79534/m.257596 type:complete len:280 (+) Transcript_79534:535-1374(+)
MPLPRGPDPRAPEVAPVADLRVQRRLVHALVIWTWQDPRGLPAHLLPRHVWPTKAEDASVATVLLERHPAPAPPALLHLQREQGVGTCLVLRDDVRIACMLLLSRKLPRLPGWQWRPWRARTTNLLEHQLRVLLHGPIDHIKRRFPRRVQTRPPQCGCSGNRGGDGGGEGARGCCCRGRGQPPKRGEPSKHCASHEGHREHPGCGPTPHAVTHAGFAACVLAMLAQEASLVTHTGLEVRCTMVSRAVATAAAGLLGACIRLEPNGAKVAAAAVHHGASC